MVIISKTDIIIIINSIITVNLTYCGNLILEAEGNVEDDPEEERQTDGEPGIF